MDTIDTSGQIKELEEEYLKKPWDMSLILTLIDVYQEDSRWEKLVEMLIRLTELETHEEKKSGYYYTIAQVYDYELGNELDAVDYYNRALDINCNLQGAFHNISIMLSKSENWYLLERNIRRMISRLEKSTNESREVMTNLWFELGDILRSHKNDIRGAVEAYRKALELSPGDSQIKKELAAIYESHGETFLDDAIILCTQIKKRTPLDTENLIMLFNLLQKSGNHDKSWCTAAVLNGLGVKNKFVNDYFKLYSIQGNIRFKKAPSQDELEDLVWYQGEDNNINKLMTFFSTVMADIFSVSWKKSGLNPSQAVEYSPDAPLFVKVFHNISEILLSTPVKLFALPEQSGKIKVLVVKDDNGNLTPVVIAGHDVLSGYSEKELTFLVARELFFLHPQRIVFRLLGSLSELYGLCLASVRFTDPKIAVGGDDNAINKTVNTLDQMLNENLQGILVKIVKQLISDRIPNFLNYIYRMEASSIRVAHCMVNDAALSFRMIENMESPVMTKTQMQEVLVSFITDDDYFEFRKKTGISIV
ncbi:tetratricopeptide repeat protein [Myxococcota bacterium]|nr:tetratricopeptide repeat protein [Myxococcota bacterium]MBU1381142.1 tetratricopeptide repeat protein [Myxococcota bacterium]MBU1496714.1 tetratricopeptide repeat protein [Myxococcota bacterium]